MSNAYDTFVAEVATAIDGKLKAGLDATTYARGMVSVADLSTPETYLEVRGQHTATGAPLLTLFRVPTALRLDGEG